MKSFLGQLGPMTIFGSGFYPITIRRLMDKCISSVIFEGLI